MKKLSDKSLFAKRVYNLDQLQWLQKNARMYMVGLTIITLFLVAAFWMYMEPWQPQASLSFWEPDSDQAVAEQQIPAEPDNGEQEPMAQSDKQNNSRNHAAATETEKPAIEKPTIIEENDADVQQESNIIADKAETNPQTVDLFALQNQLSGFTAPCSGKMLYGYGVGYDTIYDDYRFHDAVCYKADGAEVLAAADGVVYNVDLNSQWQLTLQCGAYQIRYQGLQSCTVTTGEAVIGGQTLGTAGEYLMVQAVR